MRNAAKVRAAAVGVGLSAAVGVGGLLGGALDGLAGAPPAELQGLWARGEAGCEAGVGLRFDGTGVRAAYGPVSETLVLRPRYSVAPVEGAILVRITYTEDGPGGPWRGELAFRRTADGQLIPLSRTAEHARTGAARLTLAEAPGGAGGPLRRCGDEAFIAGIRGRTG